METCTTRSDPLLCEFYCGRELLEGIGRCRVAVSRHHLPCRRSRATPPQHHSHARTKFNGDSITAISSTTVDVNFDMARRGSSKRLSLSTTPDRDLKGWRTSPSNAWEHGRDGRQHAHARACSCFVEYNKVQSPILPEPPAINFSHEYLSTRVLIRSLTAIGWQLTSLQSAVASFCAGLVFRYPAVLRQPS